jgi:hypothetical protein
MRHEFAAAYYAEAEDRAIAEMGVAIEAIKARERRQENARLPKKPKKAKRNAG